MTPNSSVTFPADKENMQLTIGDYVEYDGPTGYVPIEDARKVERKFNKLREALELISDLRKTDDVNWESMSFTAKVIADFALAELEKESK